MHKLFTSRKYAELLDCCSITLAKDPGNLKALKYKAYSLYFLERFEDAIACYDKAIEVDPDNPTSYAGKSKALEKLGRLEEARDCYKLAKGMTGETSDLGHDKNEWGS